MEIIKKNKSDPSIYDLEGQILTTLKKDQKNIPLILYTQMTQIFKGWHSQRGMTGQILKQSGGHVESIFFKATLTFLSCHLHSVEKCQSC